MKPKAILLTLAILLSAFPAARGQMSVFANAGAYWADKVNADFYAGYPSNPNTINRVLHSNTYGTQIWNSLVAQNLISPSAIGSYQQLQVVEYPQMYYRTSYQIGLGLRYDYRVGSSRSSKMGWLLRFDIAHLSAIGAFNLSSDGGIGILGSDQYIRCGMLGREDRLNIDLALTSTLPLSDILELEIDLGGSLINTNVKENLMEIGGQTYSILDVWNGQTPDVGVGSYEYYNQGGIGAGLFLSVLVGYGVDGFGALKLGYTCYRSNTVLESYTAWGWQHLLTLRVEMNNFSFF